MKASVPGWAIDAAPRQPVARIGYEAVLVAFALDEASGRLLVATTRTGPDQPFAGLPALPRIPVAWRDDQDAQAAVRHVLRAWGAVWAEAPLHGCGTFDALGRDPRQWRMHVPDRGAAQLTGERVIAQGVMAVGHPGPTGASSTLCGTTVQWLPLDTLVPWEEWRPLAGGGRGVLVRQLLAGHDGRFDATHWESAWADERLAVLWESAYLPEARRDRWGMVDPTRRTAVDVDWGQVLAGDHRRILAAAVARLRRAIAVTPVAAAALLTEPFSGAALQRACEAVGGRLLHRPNFARLLDRAVTRGGLVLAPAHGRVRQYRVGPSAATVALGQLPWHPLHPR